MSKFPQRKVRLSNAEYAAILARFGIAADTSESNALRQAFGLPPLKAGGRRKGAGPKKKVNRMLSIENDGPAVRATNYWQTEHARRGVLRLSINAGAFRLLLPESLRNEVREFKTAQDVIITRGALRGADGYEILFDDGSDNPYSIHLGQGQYDRLPTAEDEGRSDLIFSVWLPGADGAPVKAWEHACHYRRAQTLPCLLPLSQTD